MKSIKVTQPSMPEFDDYINEIKELWDNKWLTNMGIKHQSLEGELKNYLHVENITLFANGHSALENIITAFDLTGEVITTPFTFASTTHAIERCGLVPIFCDINQDDYTIDSKKIESLITEKTSAIIPVHVYGNICDVKEIARIAEKYNLKVIYDAAHAFGVNIDGANIANFGDASMFSFHATKVFNTIEGGAVTYHDENLRKKLDAYKNFGITNDGSVEYIGGNAKMNEFQAAMGLCTLRMIKGELVKREEIVNRYNERLSNVKGIELQEYRDGIESNYAYYPVVLDAYKITRDELIIRLEEEGIFARKYFYPLITEFNCYKNKYDSNFTPVAKYISERILTLPLYANLSLDDVDRICDVILE